MRRLLIMPNFPRLPAWWYLSVALLAAATSGFQTAGAAEDPLDSPPLTVVELASGRRFSGQVDARTTREQLVLRQTIGGATIWRPILSSRIVAAWHDGQPIAVNSLADLAEPPAAQQPALAPGEEVSPLSVAAGPGMASAAALPLRRVASVAFDVYLTNWDADVETDGLTLVVMPVDFDGALVPVSGTVEVELLARQGRRFQDAPQAGGATTERVERWTRTIRADEFSSSGVRLRLPFGAVHPEFDTDWLNYGLVHVRLIAPGHGTFDASQDGIRIRPWTPLRDKMELNTGRRFAPTEAVGRRD
jgi:hypothetical protein